MSFKFSAILFLFSLVITGCGEDVEFKLNTPQKIKIDKELKIFVTEINGKTIDSLIFYLDGKKISSKNNITISLKNKVLGVHSLSAQIYYNGTSKRLINNIYFLASQKPTIYTFKVINTFPHNTNAFTQGLEYRNGFLYESTGQKGESSIRKTALKTGEVLQIKELDEKYFGEGITILDSKLYQLTWQAKIGFIYDLESFEQLNTFKYGKSKEGWGLTNNGKELIKSDGTERLWFLDPTTLKEKRFIEAYTNTRKAERLNEIEFIEGKIYANIWQKNTIIIINATNGTIEGVVNLNKLRDKIHKPDASKTYVLNGIAYDRENKRLFVTGKNWDKTFEIELIKK
ncbi:glutaminyl-peptide cyclotransferase [Flavicella sp.]|uniref:glutaminyl-peptide cyclotransferase n=1 Tax=Flavicella sp. TaxID=2957742 RepID=UPI00301ACB18